MFKRKTTALFLLMATMVFLVGISVVSATSDNDTVIQDNSYSGIDQSIAEDNSVKLNEKSENNKDNNLKANSNTKQSITTVTTEPTSTDRKIKITAEVTDTSGVRIKNSYFKLYYNNQLIKTISTGSGLTRYYYTVPGTAQKATIKAVYQGNSMYASSSASYTNYVSKQNTKTTIKVEPTSIYNQVKITAEVRDKTNNLVPNSHFKVYYNGNLIKTIGTRSGITRFNYNMPDTSGDVTIKSEYQGSTVYKTSSDTYVGNPRKQKTYTYLSLEPTSVYNQVKITAEVRDDNNNLIPNSQFKVYRETNLIKTIGTRSGITKFDYNSPDTYVTIIAQYQGSANYYSSYGAFHGEIPQKKDTYTYLTVSKTDSNKICITAQVTDTNYNLVKNSKFNLYFDGKLITTIGTGSGMTRYYYTIPQQYSNYATITAKYLGNSLYKESEDSEEIYVPDYIYKTIELYTYRNFEVTTKYADGDEFSAWYQTYDAQSDKGVYLHSYPIDGTDMDSLSHNLIVDARFYFKNNAGNIISRQFDTGDGMWMSHQLISGYTPYKVVARYRKMTQHEQDLMNSGYWWDVKTDEWHYTSSYK